MGYSRYGVQIDVPWGEQQDRELKSLKLSRSVNSGDNLIRDVQTNVLQHVLMTQGLHSDLRKLMKIVIALQSAIFLYLLYRFGI